MKRFLTALLLLFALSLENSAYLAAQSLSADRFLGGVSANPVGDQAELRQSGEVYQTLIVASPAEVERVLPAVLRYARPGNIEPVRIYALRFLLAITARPDGADLLSSRSGEISSLITDDNPTIQAGIVSTAEILMMQSATDNKPYVTALTAAVLNKRTPQDVVAERMIRFLTTYGRNDPDAVKAVLAFLQRDDLTSSTRSDVLRELSEVSGLPKEVNQYLIERLDDPAPSVRAAAVIAFADSTTEFHLLAKNRVEKMAGDSQENSGVRDLAKKALAGQSFNWDPNIYVTPDNPTPH